MKTSTKTLITISVILNVLFLGFQLGKMTTNSCNSKRMHHKKNYNPKILAKLDLIKEESKKHMQEMEKTRAEVINLLTAETFDPIAFDNISREIHQCREEMMCGMTDKIKALALEMNLEERRELAEIIKDHFNRGPGHGKNRHHKSRD